MSRNLKWLWLALKTAAALAIVFGVVRHFVLILQKPELDPYPFAFRLGYIVPAGLLYLTAHSCWGWFWVRLLRSQGVRVSLYAGLRAYFVSQFGKYIPGKVAVIVIRMEMLRLVGAHRLPVAVTATYETLSSMGAGAMVAAVLLPWIAVLPEEVSRNIAVVVAIAGLPLGLGILNNLVARRVAKVRGPDARPLPSPPLSLLGQGLLQGAVGWCLLGLSLALTVEAVAPDPPAWHPDTCLTDLGAVALSYVAGFVVLVAPGGIGVRELVLEYALRPQFLATSGPTLAGAQAAVVALILRLTWTVAEICLALALYAWRPGPGEEAEPAAGVKPSDV
ncbi:MAG: hypothetical protein JWO38_882 [Gemmataceae bacterium]|nr:hypothetical protein [Gemmataceae bacterium]